MTNHRSRRVPTLVALGGLLAALCLAPAAPVALASAVSAVGAVGAPAAPAARADAAAPTPIAAQEWLYPGRAGSVTCSAPAEYHDGRLKNGVLKAEYIDFDSDGDPVQLNASEPAYACNGYSAANVADVKAWSAQQYLTTSLADLPSEEALTGNPAKVATAVSTLVNLTSSIGFTGVDVDFENYWSWVGNDQANYYGFLAKLAAGLHAAGLKLQVEGPPDVTTGLNYGQVLAAGADQVVMMVYDDEYQSPVGSTCLAFTPFSWERSLITGALAQIPAAQQYRFVAGLPAEAYTATAKCQTITGNLTFKDMQAAPGYSSNPSTVAARRDPGSGEIRWSSGGSFYDYVDQTALDEKLALARSLGVTSISVWTLGGGNPWFSASALNATALVSTASGRCLDDPADATANLTPIDVSDCTGTAGQSFYHASDNSLQTMGKCLDAKGQGTQPGTEVDLYTCNGGANQQWQLNADGSITGVQSGDCLDVTGGAVDAPDGTPMELWPCTGESNELWTRR